MKREVKIENKNISYSIRRSKRAKRMRIAVYCDGSVVVTSPHNALEGTIKRFLCLKTDWILKKIDFFSKIDIHPDIATHSKDHFKKHKTDALKLVSARVEYFAKKHRFKYQAVKVKMLKTKWGSCSAKKNLNFNYKIVFLPKDVQDYVILHELCHLKHMNHSKRFWNAVEKILPNYKELKKQLKKVGF